MIYMCERSLHFDEYENKYQYYKNFKIDIMNLLN